MTGEPMIDGPLAGGGARQAPPVLPAETKLAVATLSDWHVGSGTRVPGRVDVTVRRDRDGLPYLPGTTLTGVLRDACLTVARALDYAAPDGPWTAWHRVLFGDQATGAGMRVTRRLQPATVGIGPARLAPGLRGLVAGDPTLVAETTFVKPGVAIDPETGRAADDMLRFVEMARAGLPLRARVRLDLPVPRGLDAGANAGTNAGTPGGADGRSKGGTAGGPQTGDPLTEAWLAASALLVLGAAWCDRVGGDRRRGAGLVALRWPGQEASDWAAWLAETGWVPPPVGGPDRGTTAPGSSMASTTSQARPLAEWLPGAEGTTPEGADVPEASDGPKGPVAIGLLVRCLSPVRVPRQVVGNVVLGHDHLPGSALLAWLSSRWGEDLVRDAVASREIAVRHAYPELAGQRGVPAPLSVFRVRRTGEMVNATAGALPAEPVRQVRDRWTLPDLVGAGGELLLWEQPRAQATHNVVSRATQRPDSSAGIYGVEVLPAGTRLRATVLVGSALAAGLADVFGRRWWEPLAGPTRMGARRQGEYGQVHVTVDKPTDGCAAAPPVPERGQTFRVWAVSDLVVRDRSLRLTADPDDVLYELVSRLDGGDLRLEWAGDDGAVNGGAVSCAARTRRRDSWQGRWQLPRDSVVGLAAGSVLALRVTDGTVDPRRWADVAVHGLGDRRAEGFGEILLDPPLLARHLLSTPVAVAVAVAGDGVGVTESPRRGQVAGGADERGDAEPDGAQSDETELDEAEREALGVLRRRAVVTACRDRAAVLRSDDSRPSRYTGLRAAFAALSPSQRSSWRTLVDDAVLRGTDSRLRGEIARWLDHQGQARRSQSDVASRLRSLLDGDVEGLVELGGLDTASRVEALAVFVDDIVDELRRPSTPPVVGTTGGTR